MLKRKGYKFTISEPYYLTQLIIEPTNLRKQSWACVFTRLEQSFFGLSRTFRLQEMRKLPSVASLFALWSLRAVLQHWRRLRTLMQSVRISKLDPFHLNTNVVIVIGDPALASARLQFCQSWNGVASFIGPLVASKAFFSGENADSLVNVQYVYLAVACAGAAVGLLFFFTKLPEVGEEVAGRKGSVVEDSTLGKCLTFDGRFSPFLTTI